MSFRPPFVASGFVLAFVLTLASCSGPAQPDGVVRVAVLPFENLSGDSSLDWLSDAAQHVIVWQQTASPVIAVLNVRNGAAAVEQNAQRVLRGTIEREKGGKIRLDTWLEDRETRRQIAQQSQHTRADSALFTALNQIAATLGASPRPYATKNINALRALMQARGQADPASARERFDAALAADPAYAVAHLSRMEYEFARRDLDAARQALAAFRAQAGNAPADAVAEANQIEAALNGDVGMVASALQALAAARPANAALQNQAAERAFRLLPAKDAVAAWQRLLRIEPRNADGLRMMAYARAAAGDFAGARATLDQYQTVAPQDLNVLDSRGEIEYQAGQFAAAAAVFSKLAATKPQSAEGAGFVTAAPGKAAYAALLDGNEKAADELFEKGLVARKMEGPAAVAARATWLFQTARREQAFALLRSKKDEPVVAGQECLLRAGAGEWAEAAAAAQRAGAAGVVCGFLSQPAASDEEWRRRAETRFADPRLAGVRQRLLGYALALRGHCAAAVAPLRSTMNDLTLSDNMEARLLLGRCYYELKQWPQMREVLAQAPVPPTTEPVFSPLVFPAMLQLRADVEQHFERPAEMKRWAELYRRLTAAR